MNWDVVFRASDAWLRRSDIRALLEVTEQAGMISLAGGLPAPELFPVDAVQASMRAVLADDGEAALQYGPTAGYGPLRELIAKRMRGRGCQNVSVENVIITAGSQQGLDLLGKVLIPPGGTVVIESPTYVGAVQAFAGLGPNYCSVDMDEEGLRADALSDALDASPTVPAALYTIPSFQNPSGRLMSAGRRQQVLELAGQHGVPMIEDDPYSELFYDEPPPRAIRALDSGEEVIYCGTVSKILAPGLRVGWVIAPLEVARRVVLAKQGADLHTNSLVQRLVWHMFTHFEMTEHIHTLRAAYGARRTGMLRALESHFPEGVTWTQPSGGFFLWVTFPAWLDAREMLVRALAAKVAFVPGSAFAPQPRFTNSIRLNFSNASEQHIEDGIRRLAQIYQEMRDHPPRGSGADQAPLLEAGVARP